MKHELIITTLLATTLTVSAQEEGRNMAAIGFGASHDSWNIELDYDYMVFPYAGIGIGAQFDRENGDGGLLGEIIREETGRTATADCSAKSFAKSCAAMTITMTTTTSTRSNSTSCRTSPCAPLPYG